MQRIRRYAASTGARTKRAKVWSAMRILRSFSLGDLVAVCEVTSAGQLRCLLWQLKRAGYLSLQHKKPGSPIPGTYRLIRDTGPLCPMTLKSRRAVFDPNEQKEYAL
jgi:hypothetical protein